MQSRWKILALAVLVPTLVTAGMAVAADEGGRDNDRDRGEKRGFRFGPPGVRDMGELTYGELHVRKDGKDTLVRIDKGEVQSVSDDSISIKRNDGDTVSIPVDDKTKVHSGPFRDDLDRDDVKKGQQVIVIREGDGAAKSIGIKPKGMDGPPGGMRGPHPGFGGFPGGPPGGGPPL